MTDPVHREKLLRDEIVRVLTTHPIVDVEQGRSFPLTSSEAVYAAHCLLVDPGFRSAVGA